MERCVACRRTTRHGGTSPRLARPCRRRAQGRSRKALAAFNDAHNKDFHDRDLFVYCFNTGDGKFTAYELAALIGADIRQFKLYNEPMGQRSYDVVHDAPEGTVVSVDYKMPKPNETKPSAKQALEARVGDQACGVSYFK